MLDHVRSKCGSFCFFILSKWFPSLYLASLFTPFPHFFKHTPPQRGKRQWHILAKSRKVTNFLTHFQPPVLHFDFVRGHVQVLFAGWIRILWPESTYYDIHKLWSILMNVFFFFWKIFTTPTLRWSDFSLVSLMVCKFSLVFSFCQMLENLQRQI